MIEVVEKIYQADDYKRRLSFTIRHLALEKTIFAFFFFFFSQSVACAPVHHSGHSREAFVLQGF